MLSISLVTLGLTTIGAYAKPMVRVAASLEVSLSTPANKVASISELRIVSTVKNVGDENLKVVKLGTVLDNEHYTRSFTVTKDGKQVPFTGVEVPVSTDDLSEKDLVVIPAGENVTSEHNVAALYDFSAAGPGVFTFDPVSSFQVIGLDDTNEAISYPVAINVGNTHPISVTVTDDVSKRELDLNKRLVADCPAGDRQSALRGSFTDIESLITSATTLLQKYGKNHEAYTRYFWIDSSLNGVFSNFATLAKDNWNSRTLRCAGANNACKSRGPVYVSGDSLVYCDSFFSGSYKPTPSLCDGNSPNINSNRGALAFREFTHLLLHTGTYGYGCSDSAGLSDPLKTQNSDNYVCFAIAAYKELKCGGST